MRRTILAIAVAAAPLTAATAWASDETDVLAVVKDYNDALNKGDQRAAAADCAPQLSITDEFAPYSLQGSDATAGWFADYATWTKQNVVTNEHRGPWQAMACGGRRRPCPTPVVPAAFTYTKRGAKVVEAGLGWAFALAETSGHWPDRLLGSGPKH